MLRALVERDITPDLVLGTSIGALNGAAIAADPVIATVDRLEGIWTTINETAVFSEAQAQPKQAAGPDHVRPGHPA